MEARLRTESGNYHVDYMLPDVPATTEVEGDAYKWLGERSYHLPAGLLSVKKVGPKSTDFFSVKHIAAAISGLQIH